MLTLFFRSIIIFVLVVVMMRTMGKREMGQLQPFELVISLMIADFAASPLSDISTPLVTGLMPIIALVLINNIFNVIILKSQKLRRLIGGKPVVLVRNGRIDLAQLDKNALPVADLLEQIRLAGYPDITEVGAAIFEPSGQMSVFPISQKRPATTQELGIQTAYETVPLTLIIDGEIQTENLRHGKLSDVWLAAQLQQLELAAGQILLMSLSSQGVLHVQLRKGDAPMIFKKLDSAQEAIW
jgi:uncharacterized membrane protein YcaP (DUF421 family)